MLDSFEVFREGLAKLLQSEPNINVVSTCSTLLEAIESARVYQSDIVLTDIDFPEFTCAQVILRFRENVPNARIVVLTHSEAITDFFSAIRAGATVYMSKRSSLKNIARIIAIASEGKLVIDPPMVKLAVEALSALDKQKHLANPEQINNLSQQEKAVLVLIAQNKTNKQIASDLHLSENTVKVHIHNILQKLKAYNRLEAAACAIEHGLLNNIHGNVIEKV